VLDFSRLGEKIDELLALLGDDLGFVRIHEGFSVSRRGKRGKADSGELGGAS